MRRLARWLGGVILLAVLLFAGVAVALKFWVRSDDFRHRVSQQISTALGVPVELGSITVDVWPLPAVALERVQVKSQPPLALARIEARPEWAPLLQGRLQVATLLVREVVVPEQAVAAIAAAFQKQPRAAKDADAKRRGGGQEYLPRHIVLDQVTWITSKGDRTTVDARARLDDDGLPASAEVELRKGRFEGAKVNLQRQPDHWAVRAAIASGTVNGKVRLQAGGKTAPVVHGEFELVNLDVAALVERSKTLTGRLDAHTTLRASLQDPKGLPEGLQTDTRFTVRNAVLHGLDLAQAVKTVGMSRGGETKLDSLAGHLRSDGRALKLSNLAASSGVLSATGTVAVADNRSLSGQVTVNLAAKATGTALGVPLVVGGTLDSPSVTLSRGALVGAAIGTLIAPGVGTGAGAKLGDSVGEGLRGLFGK